MECQAMTKTKTTAGRLNALFVARAGVGMHADGGNLYLQVTSPRARSWLFVYRAAGGKKRYLGLGSCSTFSLSEARERARRARQLLADGHDPIERRREQQVAARLEAAKAMTFKACADAFISARKAGWRNERHARQWESSLRTYAHPVLGTLPVAAVDTAVVMKIVQPLWETKTETAARVRGRIESVLDWATASGLRTGDNPAAWRVIGKLLPAKATVRTVVHHAAVPYQQVPAVVARIRQEQGTVARALETIILTAGRSLEVRAMMWSEVDMAAKLWTIPGERMKGGKEHRAPLSPRVLEILTAQRGQDDVFVFPGERAGRPVSSTGLRIALRKLVGREATLHGFRSSFRDWAAERTAFPDELIEVALAHINDDKTKAAYLRSDLIDRRRQLAAAWARFCSSPAPAADAAVPIRAA
jgi:integrase